MRKIKKILKLIWEEFIYGGHLLSLGALGMVWSVIILLGIKTDWQVLIIAYLVSQIVYTYNHFREFKTDLTTNPERVEHLQKSIRWLPLILSFYFLVLLLLLILFTNLNTFLFILFLVIIGILFSEYFKGLTKKLIGLKSFFGAFFWALGTTFLPLFHYFFPLNLFFVFIFLFVFLRFLVSIPFFDIKDIESDKASGLKTLPIVFGKETTLKYLNLINFFSFSPLILGVYLKIIPIFSLSLILLYFYSFYYLKKVEAVDSKKLRLISYIMVDGEYILWPLILMLSRVFIS